MSYNVPLRDIRFVLDELLSLESILNLPGFEDISGDVVSAILDENARFVEQELAPLNRLGDVTHARLDDGVVTTPPGFKEAFEQFATAGWQGLQHDPDVGGQGLPRLVGTAVTESLNAANLAFSLCPLLTDGVIEAIGAVGSREQKARFIPPLIQGRWTGTMNLTEPQAGSDLSLLTTRAIKQSDGSYRLTGQKIFITYGEHDMAENIVHLVLARTPDAPAGVKGISLFIVPKFLVNDDGTCGERNDVWCASLEDKLGIHASPTAVMLYGTGKGAVGDGAVGYLLGAENQGLSTMFIMMNAARFAVGLQGVALADRAQQQAFSYAQERIQGRSFDNTRSVPINYHPDVQRQLLLMRGLTEGGRALTYFGAAARDHALHDADPDQRARHKALYEYLVPIVKGFCTESAVEVASLALQVHGGTGYIEESGVAQHYRDARILPIYEGTTAIQANDLVGRKTWRDAGAVAQGLASEMRSTLKQLQHAGEQDSPQRDGLAIMASHFGEAIDAYEKSVAYILATASGDIRAAFLGSVPYLMLSGTVLAGWQMMRAGLLCHGRLQSSDDDPFYEDKLATSVMYAAHILPRSIAMERAIAAGEVANRYAERLAS